MPLVNMKDLLLDAQKGGYAVGSFSIANMEMILGVIKAAEETKSPIILQIAEVRLNHSPLHIIGPTMIAAAKNAKVPVAVHLDHGTTLECIKEALELGFTSVMFDGSHLDVEENIAMRCTSPQQAKRFYEETKVDALAIAIGNAHGFYKEAPELRFDILEKVRDAVEVPLVLHGGTGIEPEDFIRCHQSGIKKINIATATFASVEKQVRSDYAEDKIGGYYDLHQSEIQGAYNNAKAHMEIFYSVGKAE